MPTLISIVDHWETFRLSYVGLLEFAKWTRGWRRSILTIVTLYASQLRLALERKMLGLGLTICQRQTSVRLQPSSSSVAED
jgi:hypothetical protein